MEELKQDLLNRCSILTAAGIHVGRIPSQVEKYGPIRAVQNYLRSPVELSLLKQAGILDSAIEVMVVNPKYGELFSDEEVNECFAALLAVGYYTR